MVVSKYVELGFKKKKGTMYWMVLKYGFLQF